MRQVVGESEMATDGGNSDLLNALNVATFKGDDEDEQNFWNRLIPVNDRSKEVEAAEPLGVRAARLRNAEEVTALTAHAHDHIMPASALCILRHAHVHATSVPKLSLSGKRWHAVLYPAPHASCQVTC